MTVFASIDQLEVSRTDGADFGGLAMGRHLGKTISCCSHVLRTKKAEIDELLKNTCAELRSEENEKDLNVCVCIAPIFLLFYVYTRRVSLRADGYPHVKVHA